MLGAVWSSHPRPSLQGPKALSKGLRLAPFQPSSFLQFRWEAYLIGCCLLVGLGRGGGHKNGRGMERTKHGFQHPYSRTTRSGCPTQSQVLFCLSPFIFPSQSWHLQVLSSVQEWGKVGRAWAESLVLKGFTEDTEGRLRMPWAPPPTACLYLCSSFWLLADSSRQLGIHLSRKNKSQVLRRRQF